MCRHSGTRRTICSGDSSTLPISADVMSVNSLELCCYRANFDLDDIIMFSRVNPYKEVVIVIGDLPVLVNFDLLSSIPSC